MLQEYPIEQWLTEVQTLHYADYWNNEIEEQGKAFWVHDGNFQKMEQHLARFGLVRQLEMCIVAAKKRFGRTLCGTGCDLAAGTLWAESHLLRLGSLEKIYCVEYSRHRLLKLGPEVLTHYQVPPEKIVLVLGDFHYLKVPDHTLNFVFLSQAFHHSDTPGQLLSEIRRVLNADGFVVMIGEHISDLSWRHYAKQPLKYFLARSVPEALQRCLFGRVIRTQRLWPDQQEALLPDPVLGDHYYTTRQYEALFLDAGFRSITVRSRHSPFQAFVLVPSDSSLS